MEVFLFAREHWWLSQAFLIDKHPSRWCLCTIQHCRDRSRQFCKTLCNVLLTSQLSFKCRILGHKRTHLLLQRSHCIFHFWDRVGSHARVESSRSVGFHRQHSATRGLQQLRDSHKLSSTRDFASRPPTSSSTRSQTRNSQSRSPKVRQRTQQRSATMFAVCLLCVLRARYDLLLDTEGLRNTSCDSVRL